MEPILHTLFLNEDFLLTYDTTKVSTTIAHHNLVYDKLIE